MLHMRRCVVRGLNSIGVAYTHKACFPSLSSSSLRFISTGSVSDRSSFVLSYLVNSCHLSPESALSASKRLNFKTPDGPDSVISFLKDYGFSQAQISEIVRKFPPILVSRPQETLSPKFHFFYSLGFSSHDLAELLVLCPKVLYSSVDDQIIPTINCLAELLHSRDKAIAFVKRFPSLCVGRLLEIVALFRHHEVSSSRISEFVKCWPRLTWSTVSQIRGAIQEVEAIGISPLKFQFVLAVATILVVSKSKWEKRLNAYKYWGLSEEDVMAAFRKLPLCMMASNGKIMRVMDFLVSNMSLDPHFIVQYPIVLQHSLEKRIIPRAAVLRYLISKGSLKNQCSTISRLFHVTEKTFMEKCINCFQEAPELKKLYAEKLDLSQRL